MKALQRQVSSFSKNTRGPGAATGLSKYGVMIVDESHYLKSHSAKRTQASADTAGGAGCAKQENTGVSREVDRRMSV